MNGGQDLGGMQGFGPVRPEANEPVFHARWEERVFALTLAAGALGKWNIDQSRSARESVTPARYLTSSYYQVWLNGLQTLLVDAGLADAQEIADGRAHDTAPSGPAVQALQAKDVAATMARGGPAARELPGTPAFSVGQQVRVRQMNPAGHTRAPRYIRDRTGTIAAVHGAHVYPDSNAQGNEDPQWLYSVRFDAHELWGVDTTADAVFVDCWQPYLGSTDAGD